MKRRYTVKVKVLTNLRGLRILGISPTSPRQLQKTYLVLSNCIKHGRNILINSSGSFDLVDQNGHITFLNELCYKVIIFQS